MNEISLAKKNRKYLFLCSAFLVATVAVFAISRNSQSLKEIFSTGEPYTITLNESNAPATLGTEQFGNGEGSARYVQFSYTSAKNAVGLHVILNNNGTIANSATTRITSMKSLVATFTGGEMTFLHGPTKTTLGSSQVLTSGVIVNFETDPYFFSLTNSGAGELSLTSLVITYSCIHVHSTITFETNRGSSVAPMTQTIGSAVSAPEPQPRSMAMPGVRCSQRKDAAVRRSSSRGGRSKALRWKSDQSAASTLMGASWMAPAPWRPAHWPPGHSPGRGAGVRR